METTSTILEKLPVSGGIPADPTATRPADDEARVPAGTVPAADDDLDDLDLDDDAGFDLPAAPPPPPPKPWHVAPQDGWPVKMESFGPDSPTCLMRVAFWGPQPAGDNTGERVREAALERARENPDVSSFIGALDELASFRRDLARAQAALATVLSQHADVIASAGGTARQLRSLEVARGEAQSAVAEAEANVRAGQQLVAGRRPAALSAVQSGRWLVLTREMGSRQQRQVELLDRLGEVTRELLAELAGTMRARDMVGGLMLSDGGVVARQWLGALEAERSRPRPRAKE